MNAVTLLSVAAHLRRRIGNERAKRRQRDARRDSLHRARSDERASGPRDEEQKKRDRVES
jgi:hypothetical protein